MASSMSDEDLRILAEDIQDFLHGVEAQCVKLRKQIEKLLGREVRARIPEERFGVLKWQDETGSKLGSFQVAYAKHNVPENWSHAYNVLRANNSLIANTFKEEDYVYRYWIYPQKYSDRIFRKKLNEV
jgi:hypothetical protein